MIIEQQQQQRTEQEILEQNIKDGNFAPEVMAKEDSTPIKITAYVNSRGTVSGIKTYGFNPIELEVHPNYLYLGAAGKALFRNNAYKALSDS